jgi:hypothetical protein
LKNDRSSLTPGQKKKALAAITSISGNIKAYFPDAEEDLLTVFNKHYPEFFPSAADKGVASNGVAIERRRTPRSSIPQHLSGNHTSV